MSLLRVLPHVSVPSLDDARSKALGQQMVSVATQIRQMPFLDSFSKATVVPKHFFELVEEFYFLYDQFIKHNIEASKLQVQCGDGCSRCCNQPVLGLYEFELVNIYANIRRRRDFEEIHNAFLEDASVFQKILKAMVPNDTESIDSSSPEVHASQFEYAKLDRPCPLLKKGRCSIYSYRPVSCRMYHSISHPSFCVTGGGQNFTVEPPNDADRHLWKAAERMKLEIPRVLSMGIVLFGFQLMELDPIQIEP